MNPDDKPDKSKTAARRSAHQIDPLVGKGAVPGIPREESDPDLESARHARWLGPDPDEDIDPDGSAAGASVATGDVADSTDAEVGLPPDLPRHPPAR